ncbi:MAG: MBL fold metallo-hydrolase [Candidatus Saccharibacteria bacterium]
MIAKRLIVGMLGANCFIFGCEETREAAVIDPGGSAEHILQVINEENLNVKYIINTHGHIDHIAANGQIKEATGAEILIHEADSMMLTSDIANGSMIFLGLSITSPAPDRFIKDGDVIKVGNTIEFEVIHTPGHSLGGVTLKLENYLICGDTLFFLGIGRTDLPGGSLETLIKSIKERILCFDDETLCLPGHGQVTNVGYERTNNPYLTGKLSF